MSYGLDPPGVFTYRDGVAVIQLIPFLVCLGCGIVLCWRHGFRRAEGWVILITFSLLRILAACFQLASINNPIDAVYGGALICQGIGLAPLTLLNIGLFNRMNKFVNTIHPKVFTAISLVAIAGIVVAIYGGTDSADSATLATNDLLKASVIIFVVCYIAFIGLSLVFLGKWSAIPPGENKLLICFACCAPFMVVRFLYSILGTFVVSLRPQFSVLTGDVTTFLCMAVLEEIFVVAFFVFTGMKLERLPPELKGNGAKSRKARKIGGFRDREERVSLNRLIRRTEAPTDR